METLWRFIENWLVNMLALVAALVVIAVMVGVLWIFAYVAIHVYEAIEANQWWAAIAWGVTIFVLFGTGLTVIQTLDTDE